MVLIQDSNLTLRKLIEYMINKQVELIVKINQSNKLDGICMILKNYQSNRLGSNIIYQVGIVSYVLHSI